MNGWKNIMEMFLMIEKYYLTIITANDNQKIDEQGFECKDMVDLSRVLIGFKPKRGYDFVTAHIDRVEHEQMKLDL
jgi:hypothetical protein